MTLLKKIARPLTSQGGFLIPTTLMLMATLTIVGVLVTKDSSMESLVGRNYVIHKQTEAAAEHAAKDTIANINEVFSDPDNHSSNEVKVILGTLSWTLYDGYNSTFDFDPSNWSMFSIRSSNSAEVHDSIASAQTISVLVDQSTSTINPGLTAGHVPDYFIYDIYSKAIHAAEGNSEVTLLIGYVEVK